MKSLLNRPFLILVFFISAFYAATAQALDEDATQMIAEEITSLQQINQQNTQDIVKKLDEKAEKISESIGKSTLSELDYFNKINTPEALDPTLDQIMRSGLSSNAAREGIIDQIMQRRVNQLNSVALSGNENEWYVDTAISARPVSEQQFSIFMRLFCDPKAANGRLGEEDTSFGLDRSRRVSCGADENFSGDLSSRDKFAVDEQADARAYNLSINPAHLFLEAGTFPVSVSGASNFSPIAGLYDPAIMQAIEFLAGSPPERPEKKDFDGSDGQARYMKLQQQNTLKSISTYVFAKLAAERMPTMGNNTAKYLAEELNKNAVAPINKTFVDELEVLENQGGVSISQYNEIMMDRIITSPGYLEAINNMKPADLEREKIRLMGLLLNVNYDRNHWMEILSALEASQVTGVRR